MASQDDHPATALAENRIPGKRGITREEHEKILAGERNSEWRAYYSLLWHLGGSQSDIAGLRGEDVDWKMQVVVFCRMKTGSVVQIHFGPEIAGILNDLPAEGFIFSRIAAMKESDRAKTFMRRCALVGVSGVSLHCYRYAGPSGQGRLDTRNASPKRPWGTNPWRSTGRMPNRRG